MYVVEIRNKKTLSTTGPTFFIGSSPGCDYSNLSGGISAAKRYMSENKLEETHTVFWTIVGCL